MRLPRILGHRFRSLFRPADADAALQRELDLHLDQLTKEYVAAGMTEHDAALAARRRVVFFLAMAEGAYTTGGLASCR